PPPARSHHPDSSREALPDRSHGGMGRSASSIYLFIMKIRIETMEKPGKNVPFQVLWAEDTKTLGTLSADDASAWSAAVKGFLANPAGPGPSLDHEQFTHGARRLQVSRVPRRKGLDRAERLRLAAASAYEAARLRAVPSLTLPLDRASADDVRAVLEGLHYAGDSF